MVNKFLQNNEKDYRLGVGIMLLNKENKVFVAQRIDVKSDAWQMPQGGVDEGESLEQAVRRELKEEIGTDNVKLIAESKNYYYYDLPLDIQQKLWGGQYKGQKQKWFLFKFLGEDKEIDLLTEHPEFLAWRWAEVDELVNLVIPFKRHVYKRIVQEFKSLIVSRK